MTLASTTRLHPQSSTLAAATPATSADVRIGFRECVALLAMSLGSVKCALNFRPTTSHDVLVTGNGFQVRGPNTVAVSTPTRPDVIPIQSFRGFPNKKHVRSYFAPTVNDKLAVSVAPCCTQPKSTAIRSARIDMRPEGGKALFRTEGLRAWLHNSSYHEATHNG